MFTPLNDVIMSLDALVCILFEQLLVNRNYSLLSNACECHNNESHNHVQNFTTTVWFPQLVDTTWGVVIPILRSTFV